MVKSLVKIKFRGNIKFNDNITFEELSHLLKGYLNEEFLIGNGTFILVDDYQESDHYRLPISKEYSPMEIHFNIIINLKKNEQHDEYAVRNSILNALDEKSIVVRDFYSTGNVQHFILALS
ncbi:hypothetical protein [Flavobacterium sp.]|uniref:hypothetical protein n=1 Tax=Flavobacterium sp. TaxID=239 RepID=UPI003D6B95F2